MKPIVYYRCDSCKRLIKFEVDDEELGYVGTCFDCKKIYVHMIGKEPWNFK